MSQQPAVSPEPTPEPAPEPAPGPVTQHTRWRLGLKTYGLVFLVVVATLVGLAIASFQQRFTPVVMVTLDTSRLGSQLKASSDVKIRGLIVGEVRGIAVTATGARLELALQPDQVSQIPANVTARLLPKTLFGERFVDLVPAAAPSPRPIRAGDVITQDRSSVAIELETVFDNLYPLLRAVQPAKLATTLGALATTLDGRGDHIGVNLVGLDRYLKVLNPKMPAIQADISLLATTANLFADLTPDLFRVSEALRVTNKTVVEKDQQLAAFLVGTAGFANTAAGFLGDNEQRIIQLGQVSRPTLQVLAKYAPIYPCVAEGLVNWLPRVNDAFKGGAFHITLEVVPARNAYTVQEAPVWRDKRGPNCYGLPNPSGSQANPSKGHVFDDGAGPARDATPSGGGALGPIPQALVGNAQGPDAGRAGTAAEQQLVGAVLAPDSGSAASGIRALLAGPMLRGTVVSTQ